MQRSVTAGCAGLLFVVIVSIGRGDDGAPVFGPPAEDPPSPVPRLISLLSDPDPLIRLDSVQRLTSLGDAARGPLRHAIAEADAQTHFQIDRILLHIPWTLMGDGDAVDQAFAGYADKDAESRCAQIDGSIAPLGQAAGPALLRIVLNDPSAAVRWEAADALRVSVEYSPVLSRQVIQYADGSTIAPQAYLPAGENAPQLALAGWVLRLIDPKRAADLISRSITLETNHPSAFRGQMDFACQWLSDWAASQKDYTKMVQLLRQQAARTPYNPDTVPEPIASLFAAQADFGPFPGLSDDLRCYQEYLANPQIVYAIGRLLKRHDHTFTAAAIDYLALLMGGLSADAHYTTGASVAQRGWNTDAERELLWCVSLSNAKDYFAFFILSELADRRDDDLAAAQYLERGLRQMHDAGQMLQGTLADQNAANVQWHYLRAFRLAKDQPAMQLHLEKLLQMDQDTQVLQKDPGMAADIVPALQELGRSEQADRIFDAAYQALTEKITSAPADPMPKNNLAWLCACSGKKLSDAVKFADQAVAAVPEDPACLDTQAEAYFRTGRVQQALEIETRAQKFKPDDLYMQRQVERFRAGLAKK